MRERNRRKNIVSKLTWVGLGAVILAVIGFMVWQGIRPAAGESLRVMATTHIPVDSDPGLYNSDPPTSRPLKATMDDLGGTKLIIDPWPSPPVSLVMTSWGRLGKLETFDAEKASAFYHANFNRAPEPTAP
ncbi:MAG: hypothetical protein Q8O48_09930 [Anaerolineales bacterium]|nr:hypothetical protein [Anaerolineales bacterium]